MRFSIVPPVRLFVTEKIIILSTEACHFPSGFEFWQNSFVASLFWILAREVLMYRIAVRRDFVAQHFLIGGDWGAENQKHSHHYQLELELAGEVLDAHGYLVDIVEIEANLDSQVGHYRDQTLNELPEFQGLNPSIEHFSRILCLALANTLRAENITKVTVRLWENNIAWASFEQER
jgi:6-pyruvoyltetrahydropterin/6-carboxytetrahydropterin synthase